MKLLFQKSLFIFAFTFQFLVMGNIEYRTRCIDDRINTLEHAKFRNAWAVKCGFIPQEIATYYDSKNLYITFEDEHDRVFVAPNREYHPCNNKILENGACKAGEGCYLGSAELEFGSYGLKAIQEAQEQGISSITSLTSDSTLDSLKFQEEEIETYISGHTSEPIYDLILSNGKTLSVTATHPLVDSEGLMRKAAQLSAGNTLLGSEGEDVTITKIKVKAFTGMVYNFAPKNEEYKNNIHIAQGVLTGSHRYQSEWRDLDARILARKGN